ncbi:MAG: 16S rRNA processing protein RimM [Bacteroidales bacterium]|nr:16S rRNA processing protein RimM [Candidatus Colimorpha pelethequi]MCQ2261962.1 ribosome maturation factor RimM [Bacteroidales bacterium]
MNKEECYYLGKITKPYGLKGEVILFLDVDDPCEYADLDSAFVEIKGNLIPYFFQIQNLNGNKATLAFEDISKEEALSLVGCELYLPLSNLPKLTGNQFYYHEVIGFKIIDSEYGDIGVLRTIIEYPAQPLLQIMKDETEILIPLIDQVIDKVDRAQKTIFITAPAGLIDLYLS